MKNISKENLRYIFNVCLNFWDEVLLFIIESLKNERREMAAKAVKLDRKAPVAAIGETTVESRKKVAAAEQAIST